MTTLDAPVLDETYEAFFARAVYSYEANDEGEASFEEGDMVKIVGENEFGWWLLQSNLGELGWVPSNYFKKMGPVPKDLPDIAGIRVSPESSAKEAVLENEPQPIAVTVADSEESALAPVQDDTEENESAPAPPMEEDDLMDPPSPAMSPPSMEEETQQPRALNRVDSVSTPPPPPEDPDEDSDDTVDTKEVEDEEYDDDDDTSDDGVVVLNDRKKPGRPRPVQKTTPQQADNPVQAMPQTVQPVAPPSPDTSEDEQDEVVLNPRMNATGRHDNLASTNGQTLGATGRSLRPRPKGGAAQRRADLPPCQACGAPIDADEVSSTSLGPYHADCLRCEECNVQLTGDTIMEHNGRILCKLDYEALTAEKCSKCKKPVIGSFLRAMGMPWHKDCFVCTHCNGPFADGKFHRKEDKPYCATCFADLFAPKCDSCKRPIDSGTTIKVLGKCFHADCFRCPYNDHTIPANTPLKLVDGKIYCMLHADEALNGVKRDSCEVCGNPVKAKGITVEEKHYHRSCFRCSGCDTPIKDDKFEILEGYPYGVGCCE